MIIVISTAITYTTFSMNQVTQLTENIGTKQVRDFEKTTEEFQVVKVRNDNNKFNMTVTNTGDIPVHLTRLWIENTTDSTWPISKFDLDTAVGPGETVKNIGQNLDLTVIDTQSYYAQLISERGNAKQLFLNNVADTSLFLRLTATPSVMPTTFFTTVTLEVINTGTTQLLNLQPNMVSVTTPTCNDCTFVEEESVYPTSFDSLDPGDTAVFEWVYSFTGTNGDELQFTAGLKNDPRTDSYTVTLQTIESALNADVAIESGGLGDQVLIDDDILLFHLENSATPSGEYQMWSGIGDGGGNGKRIELDKTLPYFITNNGSAPITIPAGDWNIAMMLSSEPVPTSLKGAGEDMIFHFEDGDGVAPDNSEGTASRDLEECGVTSYVQEITASTNDAEERASNGNVDTGDNDLDLGLDGGGGNQYIVGLRFTGLNVAQGTTINSAEIVFQADEDDGGTANLIIYGEDVDDASAFTSSNSNLSNRPLTGNSTSWSNIPTWSKDEISSDTTTPDISNIIQEIVDRDNWQPGNDIVILFYDAGTTNQRAAEAEDSNDNPAPQLSITWGSGAVPDWQDLSGPHGSGSFYFDGSADCFRSSNNVSGGDDNDIGSADSTTALWFKTDGTVTSEEYIVDWSGDNCPNCDYYRIGLNGNGQLYFEYSTATGGDVVNCLSTGTYDDDQWYHVTAARDASADECTMRIHNQAGDMLESLFTNENTGTSSVDLNSNRWHVAGNLNEDGKFFKGWIDDVMHWGDKELTTAEMDDLARTNYGTGAHQFDLTIDITDEQGNFKRNLITSVAQNTAFADPKGGGDNDDWAYTQTNMTASLDTQNIASDERIRVYFDWRDSTANWEALEVDMKIDDTTMNNPYPSFMQIPYPSSAFPSYYVYDNDDEFRIYVTNTGEDGVFFTYQGTRINFNGTNGAYAGLIDSVNGTSGEYTLSENRDSIYIPAGENGEVYFHQSTDIPSTTASGTLIPPGSYRTTIWINGYSDQGETFSRSVVIGSVTVVD